MHGQQNTKNIKKTSVQ